MKKSILLIFGVTMMLVASAQWPGKGHGHPIPGDSIKHPGHGWWDTAWKNHLPKDTHTIPHPPKPKPKPGKGWHGHPIPKDTAWHHHGPPPFDTLWHPKFPPFPHDTAGPPKDTSGAHPPKDTTNHPWPPKDTGNHNWPPKDTSGHHGPPPPPFDTAHVDTPKGGHGHHPKMMRVNNVQVSPNPARGVIYMGDIHVAEGTKTEIYELNGRYIGLFLMENKSVNISTLGRGQYVVRFTDDDGVVQTGRFVIIE